MNLIIVGRSEISAELAFSKATSNTFLNIKCIIARINKTIQLFYRWSTSSAVLLATLRLERASNMADVRLALFSNRDLHSTKGDARAYMQRIKEI